MGKRNKDDEHDDEQDEEEREQRNKQEADFELRRFHDFQQAHSKIQTIKGGHTTRRETKTGDRNVDGKSDPSNLGGNGSNEISIFGGISDNTKTTIFGGISDNTKTTIFGGNSDNTKTTIFGGNSDNTKTTNSGPRSMANIACVS